MLDLYDVGAPLRKEGAGCWDKCPASDLKNPHAIQDRHHPSSTRRSVRPMLPSAMSSSTCAAVHRISKVSGGSCSSCSRSHCCAGSATSADRRVPSLSRELGQIRPSFGSSSRSKYPRLSRRSTTADAVGRATRSAWPDLRSSAAHSFPPWRERCSLAFVNPSWPSCRSVLAARKTPRLSWLARSAGIAGHIDTEAKSGMSSFAFSRKTCASLLLRTAAVGHRYPAGYARPRCGGSRWRMRIAPRAAPNATGVNRLDEKRGYADMVDDVVPGSARGNAFCVVG